MIIIPENTSGIPEAPVEVYVGFISLIFISCLISGIAIFVFKVEHILPEIIFTISCVLSALILFLFGVVSISYAFGVFLKWILRKVFNL